MGTLTPPTGGPSGTRILPGVEVKHTASSISSNGRCVSFNSEVSERSATGDSLKPLKHEPINSVSANRPASLEMQRDKMLRSALGDERYSIIEAIGAKDEIMNALFPVLVEECEDNLFPVETWVDTHIEITLDSGCCEHVMDIDDAPGYCHYVSQSPGSKRKQHFVVGNGQRV